MVRTQIQLTETQAKKIKKVARAQGVSMAELIRRAVKKEISLGMTTDAEEKHKRALAIVGKFKSGKRDFSRKHDAYLAEAYNK